MKTSGNCRQEEAPDELELGEGGDHSKGKIMTTISPLTPEQMDNMTMGDLLRYAHKIGVSPAQLFASSMSANRDEA